MKKEKKPRVVSFDEFEGVHLGADPASRNAEKVEELLTGPAKAPGTLIAKKDFVIHHNGYRRTIHAGEDISDVPEIYLENLRTEGVL